MSTNTPSQGLTAFNSDVPFSDLSVPIQCPQLGDNKDKEVCAWAIGASFCCWPCGADKRTRER